MKILGVKALGMSVVASLVFSGAGAGLLHADVMGDSVSAQISGFGRGNIAGWGTTWDVETQFTSPATVGLGVEFTGVIWEVDGPFNQCGVGCLFKNFAAVTLDITGTGFTITVTPTGPDIAGWPTYKDGWDVSIGGLVWHPGPDQITGLKLVSDNGLGVSSYSASQPIADVQWSSTAGTGHGGTATFSFVTGTPVPEPATVLLVGSILIGLVGSGRHRL